MYFLRTIADRHLAEDLAQETFLRAWTSAFRFRGDSSIRTWLFAIARRVLADYYRGRVPEEPAESLNGAQADADPHTRLDVERALAALPVSAREAIVLCDVLGFSPSEAAEVIGQTANAFRVRLHRARRRFREVFSFD